MDTFEFDVDEKLRPSVERKLTGTTQLDTHVRTLSFVGLPVAIKLIVICLRAYRFVAPRWLRERCVFDPSCSHYSELAFRQHGVRKGLLLTARRLRKCKSGVGGVDLVSLEMGDRYEIQG